MTESTNRLSIKETTIRIIPVLTISFLLILASIYLFHSQMTLGNIGMALAQSVFAGLWEEFVFRFLILGLLLKHKGEEKHVLFIIISASLFGLVHIANFFSGKFELYIIIMQIIGAFLGGIMFGFMYYHTRKYWYCVAVHIFFDIGSFLISLGSGDLSVNGPFDMASEILIMFFPAIATAALIVPSRKNAGIWIAFGCVYAAVITLLKIIANR